MLIITDRKEIQSTVFRELALLAPCRAISLTNFTKVPANDQVLVVVDVALSDPTAVALLRSALAWHRAPGTPLICVIRQNTHHQVTQAQALGSTAIVVAGDRESLIDKVVQLIGLNPTHPSPDKPTPPSQIAWDGAAKVGLALTDMMNAMQSGKPLSAGALDTGTEAVLDAIARADIRPWLDVVFTYDDSTYQHCLLVTGLAAAFSLKLGFNEQDRKRLTRAALLHDVGKSRVPQAILNKPDRLTADETIVMRRHAAGGYDMLVQQGGFEDELLSVVRHHHEYLDGSGYPDGLQGEEIEDLVRLTTLCDIYAALIEHRIYKPQMSSESAFQIMFDMGDKLDRALLRAFHHLIAPAVSLQTA
jgi:putative nucleotidyltransferase with HDIG domain